MVVKYSGHEKDIFVEILGKHPIIENKRTDAHHIKKKKKAWEKIVAEYNVQATEPRTMVQLKRLWDKMKRVRKTELARDRQNMMATGGDPSQPPSTPQTIDSVVGHMKYEIDVEDHSDGINLIRSEETDRSSTSREEESFSMQELVVPATNSSHSIDSRKTNTSVQEEEELELNTQKDTPVAPSTKTSRESSTTPRARHLNDLTEARRALIEQEMKQLQELHEIQMEEAKYKREAARLQMLQEKVKLEILKKQT